MADITFRLKEHPALDAAEHLVERLEHERGVTSAILDTSRARLFVTFDAMRTGDIALQKAIEDEGFHVTDEEETTGFDTDQPGYTELARERQTEEGRAVDLTRDAEIPWYHQ
ncbi:hypothetical protein D3C86_1038250 [compost metagenome]